MMLDFPSQFSDEDNFCSTKLFICKYNSFLFSIAKQTLIVPELFPKK